MALWSYRKQKSFQGALPYQHINKQTTRLEVQTMGMEIVKSLEVYAKLLRAMNRNTWEQLAEVRN